METVTIDLSAAEGYLLTSLPIRPTPDADIIFRANVKPLGNAILSNMYTAQWLARAMAGEDQGSGAAASTTPIVGGDRAHLVSLVGAGKLQPGYLSLYDANLRVCRAFARDGALDVARPWMPVWDPAANDPATYRTATATAPGSPVVVSAVVVGVVAAVALAVAWWARGREDAQASVESTRLRQQASVGAATRVALAYVAQGKDPPAGFWKAVTDLGNGEAARDLTTPLAIGGVAAGTIGLGIYAATRKRPTPAAST